MFKFAAASLFALASLVAAQVNDPSINSPASVVQCQPVQLSWTATKEPVWISVIEGGKPGSLPIEDFGQQTPGTKTLTWLVDIPAGRSVTMQVRDSAGAVAYSGNVIIQDSSDSKCVRKNLPNPPSKADPPAASEPASSVSNAPVSSVAAPAPAPAPVTSVAASSSHSSASTASSTRAPAAATSATPTSTGVSAAANAALPVAQIGWTGLVGVLAAFIVA
ncbi:unnamed protein product [Rhizoctonia solani]|uniref:Ser-Thr-rich glycosyl-phosphatidyl-inositol-anchored membrane family-domain-containing protein n=3 Tax=Rhizoctonia solani TaxID=456999 RepID=A0A8H3A4T7_9AGAM|nr:hypothetical protein RSOL_208260 [Rhizoctonia solani AG-3 Rhs1AP]KEP51157.1 hypothetical protein V565_066470 [Rhizoctonia solani 123E]CAE6392924.1 unnamed protein product [Rhizoctonia solani]CAE6465661.1 unnamed protein product [Rhizoctonia solani]